MRHLRPIIAASFLALSLTAGAADVSLDQIVVAVPDGWTMNQQARSNDTVFATFAREGQTVNLYAKAATKLDMASIFANGAEITKPEAAETHGGLTWNLMQTTKTSRLRAGTKTFHVTAFLTELNGRSYYGYARAESADASREAASAFLDAMKVRLRSLTGDDFKGKKYYYGFGDKLSGSMGNEVKYDVKHTYDIFTTDLGGNYEGFSHFSPGHDGITEHWQELADKITADDMYVQWSSGHGSHSGLMVGVSYNEIRDNALRLPAKEIVIFTMACYSGNLVSSFNNKKSDWEDFQSQGRTLFVMSSSSASQGSSTGPGTDPDEPNGPSGSAGSAFGHALWKSLIGYADGYVDGVKDGFTSLEEIRDFATEKTKQIGGHTPAVTGAYTGNLIMDKVPSAEVVARLEAEGGTAGLSDAEITAKVQALDRELSVR